MPVGKVTPVDHLAWELNLPEINTQGKESTEMKTQGDKYKEINTQDNIYTER